MFRGNFQKDTCQFSGEKWSSFRGQHVKSSKAERMSGLQYLQYLQFRERKSNIIQQAVDSPSIHSFSSAAPPTKATPRAVQIGGSKSNFDVNSMGNYHLIWVNYNDLTTTSLGIMVSKGNHPQMALIQVSELL